MISFWPFMDIEADLLSGFEGAVTLHLDSGIMSKDIFSAILRADKTKALSIIEPFNSTRLHASTSLSRLFGELKRLSQ